MNNASAIQEELKELNSSLVGVSRILPYSVPDGYFSKFGQQLMSVIADKEGSEDLLSATGKTMPFNVPQGYFEQLPNSVLTNVTGKGTIKDTPYDVPANYFGSFPSRVLQAAQEMDMPQKRTIPASRFVFKHIRLAAAAVLLVCIGLGAYTTVFNSNNYQSPEVMLRSVPKTEIEAYLESIEKNEAEEIYAGNLSFDSKDIVVYLNETGWE